MEFLIVKESSGMGFCKITLILGLLCLGLSCFCHASSLNKEDVEQFNDNDQRTRHKRNASDNNYITTPKDTSQRNVDTNNIKKETTCFNNVTIIDNGERLNNFTCPRENQSSSMIYCCGEKHAQMCCDKNPDQGKSRSSDDKNKGNGMAKDINIVTGISIAAGFVASVLICLFLYCCCCQRRHEIHDGVKLMWVRRSFGKELNRLEQPAYQDHMTVVNSITGLREERRNSRSSRPPSRQGSLRSNARSRPGSFNRGSRNPSAVPTPSISRRASHDVHHHDTNHHKAHLDRHHLGVEGSSNVVITVTTPSDEHGPTAPLLKTAQHEKPEVET
ncbi:hypothetical protein ACF0H5_023321 [Mactra antiquata]